jgi:hypothetical protein
VNVSRSLLSRVRRVALTHVHGKQSKAKPPRNPRLVTRANGLIVLPFSEDARPVGTRDRRVHSPIRRKNCWILEPPAPPYPCSDPWVVCRPDQRPPLFSNCWGRTSNARCCRWIVPVQWHRLDRLAPAFFWRQRARRRVEPRRLPCQLTTVALPSPRLPLPFRAQFLHPLALHHHHH